MKRVLYMLVAALAVTTLAHADVTKQIATGVPASLTKNAVNGGSIVIPKQSATGANAIMRDSIWNFQASQFTGNFYNDPVVSFGYNNDANLIVKDRTDPFSAAVHFEGDYQHSLDTGTATSGTTTTVANDSGKALAVNVYKTWVFYNVTRGVSRLITSNTATSYTLASAITGQVSGDSYQILRRDIESYWQAGFWNGSALKTLRPIFFAVDRGTTEASGAPLILQTAIQTNSSTGLEIQGINSDWSQANHATFAPNVWTMVPFGTATDSQLLLRAATAKTSIIDMQYNGLLAGRIQAGFTAELNLLVYNSSGGAGLGALKLRRSASNWTGIDVGQAADMGQAVVNVNNSGQPATIPLLRLRTATSQSADVIQSYDQNNSTKRWKVDSAYNTVPRLTAGATSDTDGFFYLPSVSGTPTGVPANLTGEYANAVPVRYDSAANRLWAYNSSWQPLTPGPVLTGTTGSIGGGALLAGACTSGTVSITSSTTAMAVIATPVTYPGDGIIWHGYVSTNGTVTVKVCAAVAATPTASTYNVRVVQ